MFHYHSRSLLCSKCGSRNAVKPLNERTVAARCMDCGHERLTEEAERRRVDEFTKAWHDQVQQSVNEQLDKNPTF